MKTRNGFVSNSSSSSFILNDTSMTAEKFVLDIHNIWEMMYNTQTGWEHSTPVESNIYEVAKFIDVHKMQTKDAIKQIEKMYEDECWDANAYIDWERETGQTYLDEALKAPVFVVTEYNSVPYEVLDALQKKYGNKLIIHHLG